MERYGYCIFRSKLVFFFHIDECIVLQHIDRAGELISNTIMTASHMNMLRLGPIGYNNFVYYLI